MSGWTLSLIESPGHLIKSLGHFDASPFSAIETMTDERDIASIQLNAIGRVGSVAVAELFRIKTRSDERIVIEGDLSFLHGVGDAWTVRSLRIDGDVGGATGSRMRGGAIEVVGNASDHAGCQMRGGVLDIHGNAGEFAGGPTPGQRSGMRGGRMIIRGNAGHHTGHRMRRGTVIVSGDVGGGVGSDMVAGTVVVGGRVGKDLGAGMRRGTIVLRADKNHAALTDHNERFSSPRCQDLIITRLVANDLQIDAPEIAERLFGPTLRRLGDRSAGGQGELWFVD